MLKGAQTIAEDCSRLQQVHELGITGHHWACSGERSGHQCSNIKAGDATTRRALLSVVVSHQTRFFACQAVSTRHLGRQSNRSYTVDSEQHIVSRHLSSSTSYSSSHFDLDLIFSFTFIFALTFTFTLALAPNIIFPRFAGHPADAPSPDL